MLSSCYPVILSSCHHIISFFNQQFDWLTNWRTDNARVYRSALQTTTSWSLGLQTKKTLTYSNPGVTYSDPIGTYSYPQVNKVTYVHQNWRTLNRTRLRTLSPFTMPALGATSGLWRMMVQRTGAGSRCRDTLPFRSGIMVTLTRRSVQQVRFALLTTISLISVLGDSLNTLYIQHAN